MLAAQASEFYAVTALPRAAGEGSLPALLLYILLALGVSFVCSLCEAVLFSASRSHIEVQVQAGRRAGRLLRQQKENVDRPITAILTLNTIAHTVGAAGAGAEATQLLGDELFGVVTVVLTLMILVFSEIIPKTIGAVYWKPLAMPVAWVIQGMIVVFYPFVTAFERLTGLLTPREKTPTVTRPELEVLAGISRGEGALEQREHAILTNLLRLGAAQVSDIMTPRTVMFALQEDMTVGEVIRRQQVLPYSRMPLFSQSTDDARSFVLRNEVLMAAARDDHDRRLKEMARPLHPVPVSMSVATVLDEFTARGEHMFLAFDEYGGTAGIVTMEDAIESLIGVEITDESDLVADLRQLADQRFRRQQELQGMIRGGVQEDRGG
ncbi:MAG: CNNM domain-containing protein [Anaerolineaceae bacterium]|nr:CNNM domain-containing protein [Anaerolineaceae bacterium]